MDTPRGLWIPPCQATMKKCPKNPSTYMPESAHILYIYIVHVYISKYITILYSCLSLYIYICIYIYVYIYALEVKAPFVSISIHLSHLSSSSYLPLCLLGFFFGSIGLLQSLIVRAFFSGCFHMVVKNPYITTACAGKAWQSSMSVWLFDLV